MFQTFLLSNVCKVFCKNGPAVHNGAGGPHDGDHATAASVVGRAGHRGSVPRGTSPAVLAGRRDRSGRHLRVAPQGGSVAAGTGGPGSFVERIGEAAGRPRRWARRRTPAGGRAARFM